MIDLFSDDWRAVWARDNDAESIGAVFTKPEVVSLILDLAGYIPGNVRLSELRVLEPSCGDGAFLVELVKRLIESERSHCGDLDWSIPQFRDAVRACDIDLDAVMSARHLLRDCLRESGCPAGISEELVKKWVIQADFLLHDWSGFFDLVVGNPPYVRIEGLPRSVLEVYRNRFTTLTNRADLYVAFMQRGLELLSSTGVLAYICANRFTKNKYGEELRRLISGRFHVRYYLNLEHTQPFLANVSAYPGIFVIDRDVDAPTQVAVLDDVSDETLLRFRPDCDQELPRRSFAKFGKWYGGGAPWITTNLDDYTLLNDLEREYPLLESSADGTRVGIGVATGADSVFVTSELPADVEVSRLLPLAVASDVENSEVLWSGHYLVNPFSDSEDSGGLVELQDYPGLQAYFEKNRALLYRRHVAKLRSAAWYRTIDRVWPKLTSAPKLLIPDIQAGSVVGYDAGDFYPHHNLYWVTADVWPLRALQAVLRSTLVRRQVSAHCVHMRGGSLRYQAQVLRRIRVPLFEKLGAATVDRLIQVGAASSQSEVDEAVMAAFKEGSLSSSSRTVLVKKGRRRKRRGADLSTLAFELVE